MTGEFAKKCSSAFLVDTFETVIGVEPLEGDKRAACDTWKMAYCQILLFPTADRPFDRKVKCPTGRASFGSNSPLYGA